jgi:hypothetical protein
MSDISSNLANLASHCGSRIQDSLALLGVQICYSDKVYKITGSGPSYGHLGVVIMILCMQSKAMLVRWSGIPTSAWSGNQRSSITIV